MKRNVITFSSSDFNNDPIVENREDYLNAMSQMPGFVAGYDCKKSGRVILFFDDAHPESPLVKGQQRVTLELMDFEHEETGEVVLTYFKTSGKYYSEGKFTTKSTRMEEIFNEVKKMQEEGNLPGLIKGSGQEFTIHINCKKVENGYPAIISPLVRS